jgi:hypothetical protein
LRLLRADLRALCDFLPDEDELRGHHLTVLDVPRFSAIHDFPSCPNMINPSQGTAGYGGDFLPCL